MSNAAEKLTPISEAKKAALQEFETILKKASDKHASDLHLKAGLPPIVRVNGELYYLGSDSTGENISRLTHEQLNSWCHALMNARQQAKYENGEEVDLGFEVNGKARFRINVCQQRGRPRLVCRHIPEVIRNLDELGMPGAVRELTSAKRGLILVTGATGSGKSTTLAAMIDELARNRSCHIVTIEDPIEFIFKDRRSIITQREVGLDTPNFVTALKYALRQDPDVLLVGEMRDQETIHMALTAAETGHLVFSTLHTVDATETINRILSSVDPGTQSSVRSQLASVLIGVISQRLIRAKDGRSRLAAVEVLLNNARVRDMIADPQRTLDLRRAIEESANSGMQSFDQCLMQHYKNGLITKEEAMQHCSNVRDFQMRLEGVVAGQLVNEGELDQQPKVSRLGDIREFNGAIEIEGLKGDRLERKKR